MDCPCSPRGISTWPSLRTETRGLAADPVQAPLEDAVLQLFEDFEQLLPPPDPVLEDFLQMMFAQRAAKLPLLHDVAIPFPLGNHRALFVRGCTRMRA